jgi:hypothetical protein
VIARRPVLHALRRIAACAALAWAIAARAEDVPPSYESPAMLHAPDLAPERLLQGPGFSVEDAAPTDGLLARFTIRSDVGVFEVHGVETLEVRVTEIGALRALDQVVQTPSFARAAAAAAARPHDAPMLAELPSDAVGTEPGVERFFGAAAGASVGNEKATRGHEQEVRALARRLGVDPYTTHPVLASKLRDVAWISFAGGALRDGLQPPVAPERPALLGSAAAQLLVYDTPRSELVVRNVERMRAMGAPEETIRALAAPGAPSLSAQAALVEALGRMPDAKGRGEVLALAASLHTPDQVAFLVRAIGVMADRNEQQPVAEILAQDPIVARQQSGQLVAVVPADTLAWTERIAAFARRPDLAAPQRAFWISGRASSRARNELEALGWAVHEGVKP